MVFKIEKQEILSKKIFEISQDLFKKESNHNLIVKSFFKKSINKWILSFSLIGLFYFLNFSNAWILSLIVSFGTYLWDLLDNSENNEINLYFLNILNLYKFSNNDLKDFENHFASHKGHAPNEINEAYQYINKYINKKLNKEILDTKENLDFIKNLKCYMMT